jgi:hypothetical protein
MARAKKEESGLTFETYLEADFAAEVADVNGRRRSHSAYVLELIERMSHDQNNMRDSDTNDINRRVSGVANDTSNCDASKRPGKKRFEWEGGRMGGITSSEE